MWSTIWIYQLAYHYACSTEETFIRDFFCNSEANASELLKTLEEISGCIRPLTTTTSVSEGLTRTFYLIHNLCWCSVKKVKTMKNSISKNTIEDWPIKMVQSNLANETLSAALTQKGQL